MVVISRQLISGVSIPAYWLSTFAFDIINYMVPCILSLVLVGAFDIQQLLSDGRAGATIVLFIFYGTSVAVSRAPDEHSALCCVWRVCVVW